jgi:hypothetical protein
MLTPIITMVTLFVLLAPAELRAQYWCVHGDSWLEYVDRDGYSVDLNGYSVTWVWPYDPWAWDVPWLSVIGTLYDEWWAGIDSAQLWWWPEEEARVDLLDWRTD